MGCARTVRSYRSPLEPSASLEQFQDPPGAGHIECWNLDPQAYESKMISFLDDATS